MTNLLSLLLLWDYPTNAVRPDSFQVYCTTNVGAAVSTWPMITNVHGSSNSVPLLVPRGHLFFAMSASNIQGIGMFSSNLYTSPVATNVPITLK